jgi:hypothetical protein
MWTTVKKFYYLYLYISEVSWCLSQNTPFFLLFFFFLFFFIILWCSSRRWPGESPPAYTGSEASYIANREVSNIISRRHTLHWETHKALIQFFLISIIKKQLKIAVALFGLVYSCFCILWRHTQLIKLKLLCSCLVKMYEVLF